MKDALRIALKAVQDKKALDVLVLDVGYTDEHGAFHFYDRLGEAFDGHFGNTAQGDAFDDNATDILLVEGSDFDDRIMLGETDVAVTAGGDAPLDGRLSGDAVFSLALGGGAVREVTVGAAGTADNTSIDDLVEDILDALAGAGLGADVTAGRAGRKIMLATVGKGRDASLVLTGANDVTREELCFDDGRRAVALLTADYGGPFGRKEIFADWRDADGKCLIEQFRVSGLGGDDTLGFMEGAGAVDVSALSARSDDWVGVLDGGPGDDLLYGTGARDRLDGGEGSDVLYGFGGDDRLWGDGGEGSFADHDTLFAGSGNDDLIGGAGANRLYAWSADPYGPLHFDDGQRATRAGGLATLVGSAMVPADGVLARGAAFSLSVADGAGVPVLLAAAATADNTTRADLVADLDAALSAAGLAGQVAAGVDARGRITLATDRASLEIAIGQFGVFAAPDGTPREDNGDPDGDGLLDADGVSAPYPLESTGLNRMLGSRHDDRLYGGTGVDFLYGNGGDDVLYRQDGSRFDQCDAAQAGDAWKDFAKENEKVWYYSGTNADDVIAVDFVTEPGILADRHLITRLTNNHGNYTFDAQIRLDFDARDDNGKLIWDPADVIFDLQSLAGDDAEARNAVMKEIRLNGGLLPPEGDVQVILIDALGGNDRITVGPTVQCTVWVDAGAGDDRVEILSGNTILPDKTERPSRNDEPDRAWTLAGAGNYTGLTIDSPQDADWYVFAVDSDSPAGTLSVDSASANDGLTLELYELTGAGLTKVATGGAPAGPIADQLDQSGAGNDQAGAYTVESITDLALIRGLTIHDAADTDWLRFTLDYAAACLEAAAAAPADGLLSGAANFSLSIGGAAPVAVTLSADATNKTIDDLLADLNHALADAGLGLDVVAGRNGERLTLSLTDTHGESSLTMHLTAGDPAETELRFADAARSDPPGSIVVTDVAGLAALEVSLYDALGGPALAGRVNSDPAAAATTVDLTGLPRGEYWLEIAGAAGQQYEVRPVLDGGGQSLLDLGGTGRTEVLLGPAPRLPLSAGATYYVKVASANLIPTVYNLRLDLVGEPAEDVDLSAGRDVVRRDIILGGQGSDVLCGGPSEDWIFGGPGNDVLCGGQDRQASDLLFGNEGDDAFQLIPDGLPFIKGTYETYVPTLTDRFDGGQGDDRVLFLGGDYDRLGRSVPDEVAIRYNRILHRYEFTSLIWDIANQRFVVDAANRRYEQNYVFYEAVNVERTVIDTRAGNDVVHGAPEYKFPNTDSEWGIDPGDRQQRGLISALEIHGGDGADQLYGGAEDDVIYGDAGDDFLFGGLGDDRIFGGGGRDLIVGNDDVRPDRHETVVRGAECGVNDDVNFAALLEPVGAGTVIDGLSLHAGDAGDWYVLPAPVAFGAFGDQQRALLTADMISLEFLDPSLAGSRGLLLKLYAGANAAGPGEPLHVLPVEQFAGVPDYYVLHVVNANAPAAMGEYRLRFDKPLGQTIDVSGAEADFHVSSTDPADQPVVIGLGDINGDGFEDFVAAVRDDTGRSAQLGGLGADQVGPSYARIRFGSADASDVTLGPASVALKLPAPLLYPSVFGTQSIVAPAGDLNGDGIDDVVVAVTMACPAVPPGVWPPAPFNNHGVYILFGGEWAGTIDVVGQADVAIRGFTGRLSVAAAGNVNGDENPATHLPYDDLIVGDVDVTTGAGKAYVFHGRSGDWLTESLSADFSDGAGDNAFTVDNTARGPLYGPGLWHVTQRRAEDEGHSAAGSFYFGTEGAGTYDAGSLATGGRIVSPDIDLSGVLFAELSFSYFLQTESAGGYDRATVLIGRQVGTPPEWQYEPLAGVSNQSGVLADPTTLWRTVHVPLGSADLGGTVRFAMDFDTIDAANNGFEGWYVDDVTVRTISADDEISQAGVDGFGAGVAGIGDFDGDGADDLAILIESGDGEGKVLIRYGGSGGQTTLDGFGEPLTGFRLYGAGDVDGDGHADLIVSGSAKSWLVTGGPASATYALAPAWLMPLGDVDGDGRDDFGAAVLETSSALAGDGQLAHQVARVYFGGAGGVNFDVPDMVLEPADPAYATESSASIRPLLFGRAGDVNGPQGGLSRADLALADAFGGQVNVLLGRSLGVPSGPAAGAQREDYRFDLATPVAAALASGPAGVSLSGGSAPVAMDQAFGLEGTLSHEMLSRAQDMGDFNGDGVNDLLVWGQGDCYVLLGPVNLAERLDASSRAAMIVDASALGTPAERMGDINGDGISDLVFSRYDAAGGKYVVSVLYGRVDPPARLLTVPGPSDPLYLSFRTFDLPTGAAGMKLWVMRFNDDACGDLLAAWPGPVGGGGEVAWIYSGEKIRDAQIVPPGSFDPGNSASQLARIVKDQTPGASIALTVTVAGDVNGDGAEDLLLANPDFAYYGSPPVTSLPKLGRAYLVLGRPDPAATTPVVITLAAVSPTGPVADALYEDFGLGGCVAALGDLNRDGYDDFAIGRQVEDASSAIGSVLVFYGSAAPGGSRLVSPGNPLPGGVTIRRAPAGYLTDGVSMSGELTVTAGDFNGDGWSDLAVGEPARVVTNSRGDVLDLDQRGHVYVFLAPAGGWPSELAMTGADVVLDGEGEGDALGRLPATPGIDLDGDRRDDLIAGAPGADVFAGAAMPDAGKLYVVYGGPSRVDLSGFAVETLTNRTITGSGSFLVDRGTGRAVVFADQDYNGDGVLDDDRYTLVQGQDERWYKFTTLGDWQGGNQIRLTPAYEPGGTLWIAPTDDAIPQSTSNPPQNDPDAALFSLGGSEAGQLVLELDLGSLLPYLDDLDKLSALTLELEYANLHQGLGLGSAVSAAELSGRLAFGTADNKLAVSDGTAAGTVEVASLADVPAGLTTVGGEVFFAGGADDPPAYFLWKSSGTPGDLTQVGGELGAMPQDLLAVGGALYFTLASYGNPEEAELWRAVGTSAGPVFGQPAWVSHLTRVGGCLYFVGDLGYVYPSQPDKQGMRVWRITPGDLREPVSARIETGTTIGELAAVGDRLFFTTRQASDTTLWTVGNGENMATALHSFAGAAVTNLTAVGNWLFFTRLSSPWELWASDGTAVGTSELAAAPAGSVSPAGLTAQAATVYLTAGKTPAGAGYSLMKYDGGGISVVRDFADRPRNLRVAGGQLYFAAGGDLWTIRNRSVVLLASRALTELDMMTVVGSRLYFGQAELSVADGATVRTIEATGPFSVPLKVDVLDDEGDAAAGIADLAAGAATAFDDSVLLDSPAGRIEMDLAGAIKALLAAGRTRATVRVGIADPNVSLDILRASHGGRTGLEAAVAGQDGVLVDVYDAAGGRLAQGRSIVDLRAFDAGTYYLRVYDPAGPAEVAIPFALEINPPEAGATHTASDRDELHGGDGDDLIIGGRHLDRIFGDSGDDAFIAECVEVLDLDDGERRLDVPAYDHSSIQPRCGDPVIDVPDPYLAARLAEQLGMPVTTAWDKKPLWHLPLYASDLNTLTRLDAADAGIADLTGLGLATNLRQVNLAGNGIVDLAAIQAGRQRETGAPVGLTRLEYLSLDRNAIADVDPLSLLLRLRRLSLDYNQVADFQPLWNLRDLDFLSIDGQVVQGQPLADIGSLDGIAAPLWLSLHDNHIADLTPLAGLSATECLDLHSNRLVDVSPLAGLTGLRRLYLHDNLIRDIESLAGQRLADDGDAGYAESGGQWLGSLSPVSSAFEQDYRFLPPGAADCTATWTLANLSPGRYELLVTWPQNFNRSTAVTYGLSDAMGPVGEVDVDQTLPPSGDLAGGRPWQDLGAFDISGGPVVVTAGSLGDGFMAADAVRLVAAVTPDLEILTLDGNPLNNRSHVLFLPALESKGVDVRFDSDPNSPTIQPIAPQAGDGRLRFDGADDVVTVSGFQGIVGVGARTITCWIKAGVASSGAISSWGGGGSGGSWTFGLTQTGPEAAVLSVDVTGGYVRGTTNLADGRWHHVAVTWANDGSPDIADARLYVDGVLESTTYQHQSLYTIDGQDVRIGAGLSDRYFAGQMNDPRIWSAALSAGQIAADKDHVLTGGEADLAGGWSFNELAGDIVRDVSPFQRHGTLGQPGMPATRPDRLVGLARPVRLTAGDADGDAVHLKVQADDPLQTELVGGWLDVWAEIAVACFQAVGMSSETSMSATLGVRITAYDRADKLGDPSGRTAQLSFDFTQHDTAIYGTKFDDRNGNGLRDAGEEGLDGVTIFNDANENGLLDDGEPRTYTDANGEYALKNVAFGMVANPASVTAAADAPPDGRVIAPSVDLSVTVNGVEAQVTILPGRPALAAAQGPPTLGVSYSALMFTVEIRMWGEPISDVVGSTSQTPVFQRVQDIASYLNGLLAGTTIGQWVIARVVGGDAGHLAFQTLPTGSQVSLNVLPQQGADLAGFAGSASGAGDGSSNATGDNQGIDDLVDDLDAAIAGSPHRGALVAGRQGNRITFTTVGPAASLEVSDNAGAGSEIGFTAPRSAAGSWRIPIAELAPENTIPTTPLSRSVLTSGLPLAATGIDFGNQVLRGSIGGLAWDDRDRDSLPDAGEQGLAGWTIYLDLDRDGRLDAGEPTATTATDDPGTPGDETGGFELADLVPGGYLVAETLPDGWARSFPGGAGTHLVTVDAGAAVGGVDFGNYPRPTFTGAPVTAAVEDAQYTWAVTTDHPDAGAVLAITAPTLPAWLALVDHGDGTATLSGTPTNADVGPHAVVLRVTDGDGAYSDLSFGVTVANTNDPPSFTSTPPAEVVEDALFTYEIATDDDDRRAPGVAEALSIVAVGELPGWLTLADHGDGTATLSGTPHNDDPDSNPVVLRVVDKSGAPGTQSFSITVTGRNDAPAVAHPIGGRNAVQDAPFSFALASNTFHDEDPGDVLHYAAELADGSPLPAWLHFDGPERLFYGTPANGDVGAIDVRVIATDTGGAFVSDVFTIAVLNVNDPPAPAHAIGGQAATQGVPFVFTFAADTFQDVDVGDSLSYSAVLADGSPLPAWLAFDGAARRFQGTPANDDVGTVSVKVRAADGHGGEAEAAFDITVANVNDAPTVAQSIAGQAATQDAPFAFTLPAGAFEDVDAGDSLSYTAAQADGSPLPGWLAFSASERAFSGTPGNADVGTIHVKVTATDLSLASVSGVFDIAVANVNDVPTVGAAVADQVATQDVPFTFTFSAAAFGDVDVGDVLVYAAETADGAGWPAWLHFDSPGRTFSGTPGNADVGAVSVRLTAGDGHGGQASQTFAITTANVNDAPIVHVPVPDQIATQDAPFDLVLPADTFTDIDAGDLLACSARQADRSPLPAWLHFDGAGGFWGSPANGDVGTICVELTATDTGGESASDYFRVTVENVNDPPVLAGPPVTEAVEDSPYVYDVVADDEDLRAAGAGELLSIQALGVLPGWLTLTDFGDGTARLAGTPLNEDVGTVPVALRVTDLSGATADQSFAITVANTNDPPQFTTAPLTAATEDMPYSYAVRAGDPDVGDSPRIMASALPVWMDLVDHGDGTATLAGTPGNRDVGEAAVVLWVIDAAGGAACQSFTVAVANVNDPPTALDDAYQTAKGTPVVIAGPGVLVNDSDVDLGDTVTVSAYDHASAVGAAVTMAANGGFSYDPGSLFDWLGEGTSYTDTFHYTVRDAQGATDTAAVTITVLGAGPSGVLTWHSYDVAMSAGPPQGAVADVTCGVRAALELYESADNYGVTFGTALGAFTAGPHPESGNQCRLESFWANGSGVILYPYAGKSTVGRGADQGEGNTPCPLGVRDLQVHPPSNDHLVVVAFTAPVQGHYTVCDLAARRIDTRMDFCKNVTYCVFDNSKSEFAQIIATNDQDWVVDSGAYDLGDLQAGEQIYFAVGRYEHYYWDSTEISWTVRAEPLSAPRVLAWRSAATHGSGVGEVLLAVPDDGTFCEPRKAGIRRLVVTFSEPIAPSSFTPSSIQIAGLDINGNDVGLAGITISTSTRGRNTEGVIDFSRALPNAARYVVRIQGVTDVAGIPLAGDNDRIIGALTGDANGDGAVDAADYIALKRAFGGSVSSTSKSIDLDCSGKVDYGDLMALQCSFGLSLGAAPAAAAFMPTAAAAAQAGAAEMPGRSAAGQEPSAAAPEDPVDVLAQAATASPIIDGGGATVRAATPAAATGAAEVPPADRRLGLEALAPSPACRTTAEVLDILAPRLSQHVSAPSDSRPAQARATFRSANIVWPAPMSSSGLLPAGRHGQVDADAILLAGPCRPGEPANPDLADEFWKGRLGVEVLDKLRKRRLGLIDLAVLK